MTTTFKAFVAERNGTAVQRGLRELSESDLPDGDVLVDVEWSSVNYKDALATLPDGGVARADVLVPGIDLAGTVITDHRGLLASGTKVVAHGYGIGVSQHGGSPNGPPG